MFDANERKVQSRVDHVLGLFVRNASGTRIGNCLGRMLGTLTQSASQMVKIGKGPPALPRLLHVPVRLRV